MKNPQPPTVSREPQGRVAIVVFALAAILGTGSISAQGADAAPGESQDTVRGSIRLHETVISGDTAAPKVINILPWKDDQPGRDDGDLRRSFKDEILAPIDKDEFTRRYGQGPAR